MSRYDQAIAALEEATVTLPGKLSSDVRRACAYGGAAPEALAAYAEKVRDKAYAISDEDVESLLAAGHSEDEIFEATAAAAVGSGLARLRSALAAIG